MLNTLTKKKVLLKMKYLLCKMFPSLGYKQGTTWGGLENISAEKFEGQNQRKWFPIISRMTRILFSKKRAPRFKIRLLHLKMCNYFSHKTDRYVWGWVEKGWQGRVASHERLLTSRRHLTQVFFEIWIEMNTIADYFQTGREMPCLGTMATMQVMICKTTEFDLP